MRRTMRVLIVEDEKKVAAAAKAKAAKLAKTAVVKAAVVPQKGKPQPTARH